MAKQKALESALNSQWLGRILFKAHAYAYTPYLTLSLAHLHTHTHILRQRNQYYFMFRQATRGTIYAMLIPFPVSPCSSFRLFANSQFAHWHQKYWLASALYTIYTISMGTARSA